jgi:Bacterial regulatory protein, arsR family
MYLDLLSKIRREIDERLEELRPLLAEHERLLDADAALEVAGPTTTARPADSDAKRATAKARAAAKPAPAVQRAARSATPLKSAPPARGAAGETILAALEHGSHTAGELAVVTAMSAPSINGYLRKLVSEGVVVKTEREGKAAWALAAVA